MLVPLYEKVVENTLDVLWLITGFLPSKWWAWSLIFHGLGIGILSELLTLSFLHAAAESLQKGILIDPCTPKGYSLDGKNEYSSAIHAQGNFSECRAAALTLLQKGKVTNYDPLHLKCREMFISSLLRAFLSDLTVAGQHFCEEDWSKLKRKYYSFNEEDLLHYCFSSAYIVAFLHDSLGIALDDERFSSLHGHPGKKGHPRFSHLYILAAHRNASVEEMWDQNVGEGGWNLRFIRDFNDWEVEMVGNLLQVLRGFKITWEEDSVFWKGGGNGQFRVKEAYSRLDRPLEEATWGKILTLDRLQKRGWQLPNRCFLCASEVENVNHILIHCSHEITGQPRKTSLGELGKIIQATLEKRQGDTFSKGWEEVLVNGNAKGSPKGYFKATKV
ncbi:putative apyrase 4 [Vitis vinifera]|uniref:Putative apyrase 4 n=1 Tax=Vitis vinifera TaxID=29760 RepID=A0A438G7H6_VITVI|nr:putative apyrase 4 [Vitis vinifera]